MIYSRARARTRGLMIECPWYRRGRDEWIKALRCDRRMATDSPRRETVGDTIYGETIEGRSRGELSPVCAMAFTVDRCDDQFLKPPETLAAKCY